MVKEMLETKSLLPKDKREYNASLLIFDLPALIEKIKRTHTWENGGLNAMVLLKRPEKQVVLTALHEGTEIKSYQSNDSITFQIFEGKLKFYTRKKSVTLDKGQLLTLHENIKYKLTAREETIFLLTIANRTLKRAENQVS